MTTPSTLNENPADNDSLPIDQEFIIAVTNETNRRLPLFPLTPTQIETVLLTLHRLGEFTPPSWRFVVRTEPTAEEELLGVYRLLQNERDRESVLIVAQGFLARQIDRENNEK